MNFFQWLNSLDDLLFELMCWFLFLPLTFWRMLRHPLKTMDAAEAEIALAPELQFKASLSPPIMLILVILIGVGIGIAFEGPESLALGATGLDSLVNDPISQFLMQLVLMALLPLVIAAQAALLAGQPLSRDSLKGPFYAQCYATSVIAVAVTTAGTAADFPGAPQIAAAILAGLALIYYFAVVSAWFQRRAGGAIGWGILRALWCLILHAALVLLLLIPFAAGQS